MVLSVLFKTEGSERKQDLQADTVWQCQNSNPGLWTPKSCASQYSASLPHPNPTFSLLPLATVCAFLQTSMLLPFKEAWCKFSFSDYFQLFNKTITRIWKSEYKNTQRPGATKTKAFSLLFCFPGVGLWAFDCPAWFAALTDRNLSAFFRGATSAGRLIRDRGQLGWPHTQLDHRWPGL